MASVNDASADSDSESGSDEESNQPSVTTHSQAFEAFDVAFKWLESLSDDPAHLLLVQRWRNLAALKGSGALKQTTITSFQEKEN